MEPNTTPSATPEPQAPAPTPAATPAAPAAPASGPAWAQYVGHIVRWQDGTCWLVKEDGRHWVPDGGVYNALVQKGSQVFNLPAPELDKIPDIKGNHATA